MFVSVCVCMCVRVWMGGGGTFFRARVKTLLLRVLAALRCALLESPNCIKASLLALAQHHLRECVWVRVYMWVCLFMCMCGCVCVCLTFVLTFSMVWSSPQLCAFALCVFSTSVANSQTFSAKTPDSAVGAKALKPVYMCTCAILCVGACNYKSLCGCGCVSAVPRGYVAPLSMCSSAPPCFAQTPSFLKLFMSSHSPRVISSRKSALYV